MTATSRRGFTLVELIVVTVLGSLVLLAALQVLVTNQRAYTQQNAVIQGQQGTRMALDVLFNELREASPAGGDIVAMSSDSIKVRLMRKIAVVCGVDLLVPRLWVLNDTTPTGMDAAVGDRFETGDRVVAFADNYENDDGDDVWLDVTITTADTMQTCMGGVPATELLFTDPTDVLELQADSVRLGAPIRSYETFTFRQTTLLGTPYLGRRDSTASLVTPIAGPVRATGGVEFSYLDALGAVTTVPADVRQIVVKVRTGGRTLGSAGGRVADSITAWIYTRN